MNKKEQERAVRQIISNLAAIERICLKLKGDVKRDFEVSPSVVGTLIDVVLEMCQQQKGLILILASEKRGRG